VETAKKQPPRLVVVAQLRMLPTFPHSNGHTLQLVENSARELMLVTVASTRGGSMKCTGLI
jgi:hypothetical protein